MKTLKDILVEAREISQESKKCLADVKKFLTVINKEFREEEVFVFSVYLN